ncbi:hypothetical protein CRG98_037166 [Punica granatum]|uniref:Uncharacterized protein n=1 Tax=Punica granatum TaxID=22663 RepID=A0A2I0IEJ4_PUNGR|nr:hypothetical protein CRG98_037166 [Punica granatum]
MQMNLHLNRKSIKRYRLHGCGKNIKNSGNNLSQGGGGHSWSERPRKLLATSLGDKADSLLGSPGLRRSPQLRFKFVPYMLNVLYDGNMHNMTLGIRGKSRRRVGESSDSAGLSARCSSEQAWEFRVLERAVGCWRQASECTGGCPGAQACARGASMRAERGRASGAWACARSVGLREGHRHVCGVRACARGVRQSAGRTSVHGRASSMRGYGRLERLACAGERLERLRARLDAWACV